MKTYILLFLVSMFQTLYAPSVNNDSTYIRLIKNTENTKKEILELEKSKDSLDLIALKALHLENKFSKTDRHKARKVCSNLGIETKWLYAIIKIESSGNKNAVNKYSGATGLIGFLPSTAKRLGTSTKDILNMSNSEQLCYIEKYLKGVTPKGYKLKSMSDVYLAIFYPMALGKANNYVIGGKTSRQLKWNRPLDTDKDSILTVHDLKRFAIASAI